MRHTAHAIFVDLCDISTEIINLRAPYGSSKKRIAPALEHYYRYDAVEARNLYFSHTSRRVCERLRRAFSIPDNGKAAFAAYNAATLCNTAR